MGRALGTRCWKNPWPEDSSVPSLIPSIPKGAGIKPAPSTSSWHPVISHAPHRTLYPHPRVNFPSRVSKPLRPPQSQALLPETPVGVRWSPVSEAVKSVPLKQDQDTHNSCPHRACPGHHTVLHGVEIGGQLLRTSETVFPVGKSLEIELMKPRTQPHHVGSKEGIKTSRTNYFVLTGPPSSPG